MNFKIDNLKKFPWGVFAAVGTILVILLTGGIIGGWFIVNAVAGQTGNTATIFSNWWQVLIFILDIIALPLTVGCYYLFFKFKKEKAKLKRLKERGIPKIFAPSVYGILAGLFAILFIGLNVGESMTLTNSSFINEFLGIQEYYKVQSDTSEIFNEYKSDYVTDDGKFDDKKMRENSLKVATQVAVESTVLLKNEKNALPLRKDAKISLFGISTVKYRTSGSGSGEVAVNMLTNLSEACKENGINVNPKLYNAYKMLSTKYGNYGGQAGYTLDGTNIGDRNYVEYGIKEAPWTELNKTSLGEVSSTFPQYGDAAVMIISRNGGEDGDTNYYTSECIDGNYLDLAIEEANILNELMKLKQNGTFKKVVLIINAAQAMQMKHIAEYDLDAIVWAGTAGNVSYDQIALVLSGNGNPSGRLIDTYAYDNYSAPSSVNFGNFKFAHNDGLPKNEDYSHNDKYLIYQEGIYVGYRYYETRYEDVVLQKSGVGSYDYKTTVAYPFGYGLSYTTFARSNFKVKEVDDGYNVSLTVKNTGTVAGKEVVQIYLQKPYTQYDKDTGIEKASVELVGYAKTKELKAGESEDVTVFVEKESFKTYDSYGHKTYIVEAGDYYLSAGVNAHDALNNILAEKGKKIADGMTDNGNPNFTKKITVKRDDFTTYAKSTETRYEVTNRFDQADPTLYEGTKDQFTTFKYLSRSDWTGTYPSAAAVMDCLTQIMIDDFQYTKEVVENPDAVMPTFGKSGTMKLLDLWGLDYDDPDWDKLLDQLTWTDAVSLVTAGGGTSGAVSVGAPGGPARDGPVGIRITNANLPNLMCFPSECNMAATYNDELINELGNAFGMEILHVGYTGIYGPAAGIHRSAYSGRNWEYYSEDPYISGKMLSSEVQGLQSRGVIVFTKHFLLNDEERNRYGLSVWANEQSIREIYLKAFEAGVTEGNMNGVMSSFNRIGATWTGKHKGLLTEVLRNEWGFLGVVQTDAYVGTHMHKPLAESVVAGNDFAMGGANPTALDSYKNDATVATALRDCAHRILYTQLHSNAMNGLSMDYKIVYRAAWWKSAFSIGKIVTGIVAGVSALMLVLSIIIIYAVNKKHKLEDEREIGAEVKYFFDVFPKSTVAIVAAILVVVITASVVLVTLNGVEKPAPHTCESVCSVCGGCKDASCVDDACTTKCTCKVLCEHACSTCGRCLDMNSTDDLCKEKCGDGLQNSQKFEAEDDKVLAYPGALGDSYVWAEPEKTEETYVGGLNENKGAKLKFAIDSDKAGTACLIISVSKRSSAMTITDCTLITVNGTIIESKASLPAILESEAEWYVFADVNLGCIQLKEGRNVIEFTIIGNAFNFNAITIKSDINVSWYEGSHVCDDVCATCGLCKNEYCVDSVCLSKCLCDLNKQEFNLSDGKATLGGLTLSDGVANFTAADQKVVYKIKSSKVANATLLLNVKANKDGLTTSELFLVKVNGAAVTVSATAIKNGDYDLTKACAIELRVGNNEIEITSLTAESVTLKGITLGCNETLEYGDKSYYVAKIEAENADLTKVNNNGEEYPSLRQGESSSGEFYLGSINDAGLFTPGQVKISFTVTAAEACDCIVYFGAGVYETANAGSYVILVNGAPYTSTEVWSGGGWYDWKSQYFGSVQLEKGDNLLEIRIDAGAMLNLDYFTLESLSLITIKSDSTGTDTPDGPVVNPDDPTLNKYRHEAETVTSNRSGFFDEGGGQMGERENANATGGICVGGVGEISLKYPGEVYFKWTLKAEKACDVKVQMRVGCGIPIPLTSGFSVKLNGETVTLDGSFKADGFNVFNTETLVTLNLQAGDNEFYIYVGSETLCNIDYFEFITAEVLTFG